MACEPDTIVTSMADPEDGAGTKSGFVDLCVDLGDYSSRTRTPSLEGCEDVLSGAVLYVYRHDSGLLDSVCELSPSGSTTVRVLSGVALDFYVLGNLWGISEADGSPRPLCEAFGPSFPYSVEEMKKFVYRLDGVSLGSGFRRETFAEVKTYGIPFAACSEQVVLSSSGNLSFECRRLFARISLTVDHSGLDGGKDVSYFRNSRLYLRCANAVVKPFSEGGKALSQADLLPQSDYDPDMHNAGRETFIFYVPENLQGELTDSNASLRTYIEFEGIVNPAAGGYGGTYTYRFHLGQGDGRHFDVERGRDYAVSLSFRVNSLFEPEWRVNPSDDFSDNREFYISATEGRDGRLPEGQIVVVRPSRPGKFNVCMHANGSDINALIGKDVQDAGYEAADLEDCAWTSSFLSRSNRGAEVPDREALQELGIAARYDKYSGSLSFVAEDASRFVPGKEINLSMRLLPGKKTLHFTLRTMEDISVSCEDGKSLGDGFFVAQKRIVKVRGMSGGNLTYTARQTGENCYWKTSSDAAGAFASSGIMHSGSLEVYSFYPNDCSNIPLFFGPATACAVEFSSDDSFNDDSVSETIVIRCPVPQYNYPAEVLLPFDGGEASAGEVRFLTKKSGDEIPVGDFDAGLYALLLKPSFSFHRILSGGSEPAWYEMVDMDELGRTVKLVRCTCAGPQGSVYLLKVPDSGNIELCDMEVRSNRALPMLATYSHNVALNVGLPSLSVKGGPKIVSHYFDEDRTDSRIEFDVDINTGGCEPDRIQAYLFSSIAPFYYPVKGDPIPVRFNSVRDGDRIHWSFDEAEQPKYRDGEFVPVGMAAPYGPFVYKCTVYNRWDNYSVTREFEFELYHEFTLGQFLGVYVRNDGLAFFITKKGARYMKDYGFVLPDARRRYLAGFHGKDEWHRHIRTSDNFILKGSAPTGYNYTHPFVVDSDNIGVPGYGWSVELANAVLDDRNRNWMMNPVYVDSFGGIRYDGDRNPDYTGNRYILSAKLSEERYGCLYVASMDGFWL